MINIEIHRSRKRLQEINCGIKNKIDQVALINTPLYFS